MIVKNEEATLARALESVKDAVDEIVIADTGSTDSTMEIARQFTDKVFNFKWIDDFSAARNFSFSKATQDYILWMDADDVFLEEDLQKLKELKKTLDPTTDVVMFKYNTGFDAQGRVTFSYYRERLVRRAGNFKWKEPVHEVIDTSGNYLTSDIAVSHKKENYEHGSKRNLQIYEAIINSGQELSVRGNYYYARELYTHAMYEKAIEQFEKFLANGKGWIEDKLGACELMARCYMATEQDEKALLSALHSFSLTIPRGELCCLVGEIFKKQNNFANALFWYDLAAKLPIPKSTFGFVKPDYYNFVPLVECAVCCDKLKRYKEAEEYNEKAAAFKPEHPSVLHNRSYFKKLLS
jgi:glycosyltransferase involved in cell wall biosynthesis